MLQDSRMENAENQMRRAETGVFRTPAAQAAREYGVQQAARAINDAAGAGRSEMADPGYHAGNAEAQKVLGGTMRMKSPSEFPVLSRSRTRTPCC